MVVALSAASYLAQIPQLVLSITVGGVEEGVLLVSDLGRDLLQARAGGEVLVEGRVDSVNTEEEVKLAGHFICGWLHFLPLSSGMAVAPG